MCKPRFHAGNDAWLHNIFLHTAHVPKYMRMLVTTSHDLALHKQRTVDCCALQSRDMQGLANMTCRNSSSGLDPWHCRTPITAASTLQEFARKIGHHCWPPWQMFLSATTNLQYTDAFTGPGCWCWPLFCCSSLPGTVGPHCSPGSAGTLLVAQCLLRATLATAALYYRDHFKSPRFSHCPPPHSSLPGTPPPCWPPRLCASPRCPLGVGARPCTMAAQGSCSLPRVCSTLWSPHRVCKRPSCLRTVQPDHRLTRICDCKTLHLPPRACTRPS